MSLLLVVLVSLLLVVPASAAEADPVYDLSEPVVFSAPALASAGDGFPFYGSAWVKGTASGLGKVSLYFPINRKDGYLGLDSSGRLLMFLIFLLLVFCMILRGILTMYPLVPLLLLVIGFIVALVISIMIFIWFPQSQIWFCLILLALLILFLISYRSLVFCFLEVSWSYAL